MIGLEVDVVADGVNTAIGEDELANAGMGTPEQQVPRLPLESRGVDVGAQTVLNAPPPGRWILSSLVTCEAPVLRLVVAIPNRPGTDALDRDGLFTNQKSVRGAVREETEIRHVVPLLVRRVRRLLVAVAPPHQQPHVRSVLMLRFPNAAEGPVEMVVVIGHAGHLMIGRPLATGVIGIARWTDQVSSPKRKGSPLAVARPQASRP